MALTHPEVLGTPPQPGGWVAEGLTEVRAEVERNFLERGEIGAAVAAYWRGQKVVDLWGGRRTPTGEEPWDEDTMVLVNSTTKGLAAMTIAVANSRGWIDCRRVLARIRPERQGRDHAGADSTRRPRAPHARPLLPRADRRASRD